MAGRFFVGAATTEYATSTGLTSLPELAAELDRATQLFTDLGYETVPGFGLNLTSVEFTNRLREFLLNAARLPEDVIVVYYTGHGEVAGSARDVLLLPMADATHDRSFTFLRAGDLTERLLDSDEPGQMVGQQLLFILDTCYAGAGGSSLAAGAVGFVNRLRRTASGPAVAVIVGARDYQQAGVGTFTQALTRSVRQRALAGHEVRHIPLDPLVTQINAEMAASGGAVADQAARLLFVGERAAEFFPNRRYDEWYSNVDVRTRELRLQRDARVRDREAAGLSAQGLSDFVERDDLWLFTGRHAALRQATAWLAGAGPPTMVITGDPGSGKSALLARLDMLADPGRSARIPNIHSLPPDTVPPPGSITRFVHARGLTPLGLLAALAEACGVEDVAAVDTPGGLVTHLRDRADPVTVVIDGLDEAAGEPGDPHTAGLALVDTVLAPLVKAATRVPLRLLIGTRSHLIGALGAPLDVVHLDRRYADRPSLRRYVRSCLTELVESSPYRGLRPAYLDAVVDAIAEAAGDSFLVALITARSLALRADPVADPYDAGWRTSLPREAAEAMRQDLDGRLGPAADRARDLLLPLAYAQGTGLPWEDVWPALATRLTGRRCGNRDLDWLIEHAGYYVIETRLNRGSAYRLYHAALGAHLRTGRDAGPDHGVIVDVLLDRVPRLPDGTRDWARAHPYTAAAVAGHAAPAGRLDELLAEPRLLTETPAGPLLAVLDHVRTPRARATADAYRRAAGRMQAYPGEKAAYLQLAARSARAPHLADEISASGLPLPWATHWASLRQHPPHQTLTWHRDWVTAVAIGEVTGRSVVASASADRTVRLWDVTTGRPFGAPLAEHTDWVTTVAFGQVDDRAIVISGGNDGTVRRWDAVTGRPLPGPGGRSHPGEVRSVAFGRLDGRPIVVSGGEDEAVRVWDAATGRPVGRPLTGLAAGAYCVAVGRVRDGIAVAAGGADGTVLIWDAATGQPIGEPLEHDGKIRSIAFGRIGEDMAVICGADDHRVHVRCAVTGELLTAPYAGHAAAVTSVAYGRRGTQPVIVSGSNDQTVQMWDAETGALIGAPFTGHTGWVLSVACRTREGRLLIASGGADETVRLWDSASGEPIGEPFTGHTDMVTAVAAGTADGETIVISGSADHSVRRWDAVSGQPLGPASIGHTATVTAVGFGEVDGQPVVASAAADHSVRLWDPASGEPIGQHLDAGTPLRTVAIGPAGERTVIVAGGDDGALRVWDAAGRRAVHTPLTGHDAPVTAVAIGDAEGRPVIVSGGADHTVRLWNAATGEPITEPLTGHTDVVTSVAIATVDGQPVVASGALDRTVRLWDAETGEALDDPAVEPAAVHSVAFGNLGQEPVIVSGGADAYVRIVDAGNGERVADLYAGPAGVRAVAVAGSQPLLVAGGADHVLRAWDAATRQVVAAPFDGHRGPVTAVALGRLAGSLVVVSGSTDHTVRRWDAGTGRPLGPPLTGHADGVRSVAYGQWGGRALIASAGDDRTVRLWDAATGVPVGEPFTGHRGMVNAVVFGEVAGRPVVISGGNDHTVRVWDLSEHELLYPPITAHEGYVSAVAVARLAGRPIVVTGGHDQVLRIWDAATGEPVGDPLAGHTDDVNAVSCEELSDRLVIASASNDGTVRAWDAAAGEPIGSPSTPHEGWVHTVALGRLGDRPILVSGGTDQTLCVRSLAGVEMARVRLSATVNAVAVRDAAHLVVATDLGLVSLRLPG
ncbi:caspase family protein [Hamadaea sp. NPDC051192]|uniref:caspase family protein n=1 Tax=Hamadaea sp. NPDC051192 TaxID=3154940 RepID=UPI00342C109B